MTRACGGCTLCCKVMAIEDMLPVKPASSWCEYCKVGSGCTIYHYDQRPLTCRTFRCLWLQAPAGILDDRVRPDRCKVVLQATPDGRGAVAHCDPSTPTAWRHPKVLQFLRDVAAAGFAATAKAGRRYWVITTTTEREVDPDWIVVDPVNPNKVDLVIPRDVLVEIGMPEHA